MNHQMYWSVLLSLCVLTGCLGRKAVRQEYYLLELPVYADSTQVQQDPISATSCEIAPVEIHPAFAGTRIALRTRTHELRYYAHHKWATQPGQTLTQLIETFFQRKRIFAFASSRVWQTTPEYMLQTEIRQLEVIEHGDVLSAHLNLRFDFIENLSRRIVVTHTANKELLLGERDLNLFAAEISRVYHDQLKMLAQKITAYLQKREASAMSK